MRPAFEFFGLLYVYLIRESLAFPKVLVSLCYSISSHEFFFAGSDAHRKRRIGRMVTLNVAQNCASYVFVTFLPADVRFIVSQWSPCYLSIARPFICCVSV